MYEFIDSSFKEGDGEVDWIDIQRSKGNIK